MKVTDRLLVKCISPDGTSLTTYTTYRCGDGCCSERDSDRELITYNQEVEISESTHTWHGRDLDNFKLDKDEWKILEIPYGYEVNEDACFYILIESSSHGCS